ncbi:hypothetical protein [Amphritea pacifica]|uniref:hypothetical protein n=1 Tax=Amphritea pacifica TaxID=2811233 RepID=UPI00196289EB|nr:hypothetical protein [Amphritea pacifica]MBN1007411.1 hypothetical protein [Amphritea pacifica]
MYEDGPTRAALTEFSKNYVLAQDSIELAESLAPTVADTILTVVLTAVTGVGGTVIVARAGQTLFKKLGRLLVSLGKALKKSELSKRIVSKLSNKPERFEIRRPEAQKLSEPKRVDGNRNDGTMRGEGVVTNNNTLRQTGGGGFIDPADELYDAIRASDTDVSTIAANTGIKPQNIQKVKDHVFYNEHLLDKYVDYGIPAERARFDSDLNQAQAWQRLENGTYTDADITWLKHETTERWYEIKHNSGYTDAHNAAERKWTGNPWGEN